MQRTNSQSSSGSLQPCSGSILLNPLNGSSSASGSSTAPKSPPAVQGSLASASTSSRPRRPSIAVCVSATAEPPAWYQAEQNGTSTPYGSPPKGSSKSRSNSVDRWGVDSDDSDDEERRPAGASRGRLPNGKETSIQFAPLPEGRQRSNSITIGVASRAHMLNAQGGGGAQGHYNRQQARYAGPQWCQAGGVVPPDVYTYKDLARGMSSLWRKASKKARRPSASSTTSSASLEQALDMERDAKSKGAIEHIEEADEEHEQHFNEDGEEDEHALADSDSDAEQGVDADLAVERGKALGMSMGAFRAGSVESSSSGEASEGSGALSTSATSAGTAEVGDEKWEAEALARRARKGKGKAAVQGA